MKEEACSLCFSFGLSVSFGGSEKEVVLQRIASAGAGCRVGPRTVFHNIFNIICIREREREKEKDIHRERERERERDRDRGRQRQGETETGRDRDRGRERETHTQRDRER